jgi:fibronectin type III domain protein
MQPHPSTELRRLASRPGLAAAALAPFLAPFLALFLGSAALGQTAPDNIEVTAPADTTLLLTWGDTADEESYEIERDGSVVFFMPADSTAAQDTGLTPGTTYVYRVGAVKGGNTVWSKKAWALMTTKSEFWPVAELGEGEYRVGYNYCEYFRGYDPTDYHFGVDAMRVGDNATGKKKAVAPFSGRIHGVTGAGVDQNLEVKIGGEHYLLAHLQNSVMGAGDVGGWVMAGVYVGEVGNNAFGVYGAHIHCNRDVLPYNFATPDAKNMRHLLELYQWHRLRDPAGQSPNVLDATKPSNLDPDTDSIHYKGNGGGAYIIKKTPAAPQAPQPPNAYILSGDVDIVAECQDVMNHPDKPASLYSVGYWVQSLRRLSHDIRSAREPYMLHKCSPHLFDGATDHTKDIYESTNKEVAYNGTPPASWNLCHHYIVTNTKGINGAMSNVDASQHWNTDAKDVAGGEPNGVGKGDATKASELWFADGPYRVYVQPADLIHTVLEAPGAFSDVWLENFPPAVAEVRSELVPSPTAGQVCAVIVRFSEPMNKASVESATTLLDPSGANVTYTAQWNDLATEVTLIPTFFAGYFLTVFVDASIAKDLSGGATGTGAFLDSIFGHGAHNGTSEGNPTDSVRILISCS